MEQIGLKQKNRLKAVSVFEYPSFDQAVSAVADYDGDTRESPYRRTPGSALPMLWHSIPVCRFPIFCSLHQLFEGSAAFEQRTFERRLERLFDAVIVERHPVLTHRRH